MLKLHKYALVALTIAAAVPAHAHGVGNGGNGVMVNGKLRVLDLVEAGLDENPRIDPAQPIVSTVAYPLKSAFDGMDVPKELLIRKLSGIYEDDPATALGLAVAIQMYTWRFVNYPLANPQDQETPLSIPADNLKQIAIRTESEVLIEKSLWQQLDPTNQVALILHEMVYAMVTPQNDGDGFLKQSGRFAREIVAGFFSPLKNGLAGDYANLKFSNQNAFPTWAYGNVLGPAFWADYHSIILDSEVVVTDPDPSAPAGQIGGVLTGKNPVRWSAQTAWELMTGSYAEYQNSSNDRVKIVAGEIQAQCDDPVSRSSSGIIITMLANEIRFDFDHIKTRDGVFTYLKATHDDNMDEVPVPLAGKPLSALKGPLGIITPVLKDQASCPNVLLKAIQQRIAVKGLINP